MERRRIWVKPAIFAGILLLALLLGRRLGWAETLSGAGGLAGLQALVHSDLPRAVAVYCAATVVGCVVLALPGVTFAVLAGVAFGPVLGTICCSAATTLGAGIAFLAGRYFLRDSLKPVVMKNRSLRRWLFDEPGKNDVLVLMITRLVPLFPYNLQNFAYGITDISFGRYMLFSCIFMLPGTAAYTAASAGLADQRHRGLLFGVGAVMIAALVLLGRFLSRRYAVRPAAAPPAPTEPACVSCGACTAECEFLRRHKLDFSDPARLSALAGGCFLCGRCTAVCPQGIDGRNYLLELRRGRVRAEGGTPYGSAAVRLEKGNYLFRSYRRGRAKSVLFPGCSFPSFYPQTTKALSALLAERGIGTVFDCCGKPIAEMGLEEREAAVLRRLEKNLRAHGVEEVITVCPNCYAYLKDKLSVRVVTIYEKLGELGLGQRVAAPELTVFRPCPDRAEGAWLAQMAPWLPQGAATLGGVQCCGLGGGAAGREPQAAAAMVSAVRSGLPAGQALYVYCASCAGRFARSGIETRHLLCEILGSDERPDTKRAVWNRAACKWR